LKEENDFQEVCNCRGHQRRKYLLNARPGKSTCHSATPRRHVNNRLSLGAEELALMLQPSGITRAAIAAQVY